MKDLIFTPQLAVFSIRQNRHLRDVAGPGDLSQLKNDEFFSFSLCVQNNGSRPFAWNQACVCVDNGDPWHWEAGFLPAFGQTRFHIFHCNMLRCMTPGAHTVTWYFDGLAACRKEFSLDRGMDWASVFPLPTQAQIQSYQKRSTRRSPYLYAALEIPSHIRYTEYTVEFKATHVPKGTYFCLGCWAMDLSGLKDPRQSDGGWANAYAGFQRIADGRTVSIMSFWDILCRDARGQNRTLQAKILYPRTVIDGGRFWGEGEGARCTAPFDWKPGRWYRMHLKCVPAPGSTVLEQWVCDLETNKSTLLSRIDTGIARTAFRGGMVPFLENFQPSTAGEVRSMELRNARYREDQTGRWQKVTRAHISSQAGIPAYEGSYSFGVTDGRIWMITSGVGGDWFRNGKGKQGGAFTL